MKKLCIMSVLFFLFPILIFAQGGLKVKGIVLDTNGEPLIGANVYIPALSIGAATDIDGAYEFEIPAALTGGQEAQVVVAFVGYKKRTETIVLRGNSLDLNFTLEEDIFESETVVVTGIASKTSKAVAEVAVARISAADLTGKQQYTNFTQLITGKVSGVNVQTASGNVGSGWKFIMRGGGGLNGDGQPLIYLDGTLLDNADVVGYGAGGQSVSILSNLNPADIENIEVLKGPSAAAMYGTNAANGVVLITTKGGTLTPGGSGKDYNISYTYNYGYNEQAFKYDNEKWINGPIINSILSRPGLIKDHNVSISGGNANIRYYSSFSSRLEEGPIPDNNWMDRKSLKLNTTLFPAETFTLKVNTNYTWNLMNRPDNDNNIYGWMLNAFSYYPAFSTVDSIAIAQIEDKHDVTQFIGSIQGTYTPIKNLEINAGFGMDFSIWDQDKYYPYGYSYGTIGRTGSRRLYKRNAKRYTYDFNVKYNADLLSNLKLTTAIGSQLLYLQRTVQENRVTIFSHPAITTLDAASERSFMSNSYFDRKDAGLYIENNLAYDDTYFLTLALRRDYASSFGDEAPAITYPKASLAVRLDKFGFLPSDISFFKIRASYGESGILPGSLDGLNLTWTASLGANGVGIVGNSIGNPAIEPERVKEIEVGFDAELFKMFSLEFTHYHNFASKSIVYTTLAPSMGLGGLNYPYNLGKIESWGYETNLQFNPIRSADYDLNFSLIWNYQNSLIIDLSVTEILALDGMNYHKEGYRKAQFFGDKSTTPIYNATTQRVTGYNFEDEADLGNPLPDHSGSLSANFRFLKNFTFYAFAEFGFNNRIYSYTIYRGIRAGSHMPSLILATQLGLTSKTGGFSAPGVAPLTPGTPEYIAAAEEFAQYFTDHRGNFFYDADYLTLREVSLSYDFTNLLQEYLLNSYINNLTIGMSVRNVIKLSKYELDYEANYLGGSGSSSFTSDFATLPQPRTYNFWIRLGL